MTSSNYEHNGPLREWTPLTKLLQKIPAKVQIGLFTQDINLTCIDVITEFIAIGTNRGLLYWFDRRSGQLSTLCCEDTNSIITCVKVASTVDYMVAAGSNQGIVTIFQIPKQLLLSLPETLKLKKKKQIERFKISDLHKVSVTTLEWSKNGMKLFSGDKNGLVVLTEMDFNLHLSKSTELLNEKYTVIQLSYQHGLLLISTVFRTILVNRNQNNQVIQIGQKERKMLGTYGAVFSKNSSHIQQPIIYASRPGYRIWQADKSGTVIKTLILKEAIKRAKSRVELLNPLADSLKKKSLNDSGFGIIKPFCDDLLVLYNEDIIYIINPSAFTVKSVVSDLRKVTDIACIEDEIFILEGDRSIVRIASYPDINNDNTVHKEFGDQLNAMIELNKSTAWRFAELTSKLKSNPIVPTISLRDINPSGLIQSARFSSPVIAGIDISSAINAEEAAEILPTVSFILESKNGIDTLSSDAVNHAKDNITDRKQIFQKISEQDFEEVIFKPQRKNNRSTANIDNDQSLKTNIKTIFTLIDSTGIEKRSDLVKPVKTISPKYDLDNYLNQKSERNLKTIQQDVQNKEKLLSSYLDLDLSKYTDKNHIYTKLNPHCSTQRNNFASEFIRLWMSDESEEESILECMNQKVSLGEHKTGRNATIDWAELDKKKFKSNGVEKSSENSKINVEDKRIMETHFNELSKEFITSVMLQDSDDWILLG